MATLNLTARLEGLIGDMVRQVKELSHIDPERILVCVSTTRSGGIQGTYAKIYPLRFAGGALTKKGRQGRRVVTWESPTVTWQGREMLYIISFLVPRFLNLSLREKLITVVHELYHVSPAFDGDIRRFPGRNYAHGSSRQSFNAAMGKLVDAYCASLSEPGIVAFLEGDADQIRSRHGAIVGRKLRAPKLRVTG